MPANTDRHWVNLAAVSDSQRVGVRSLFRGSSCGKTSDLGPSLSFLCAEGERNIWIDLILSWSPKASIINHNLMDSDFVKKSFFETLTLRLNFRKSLTYKLWYPLLHWMLQVWRFAKFLLWPCGHMMKCPIKSIRIYQMPSTGHWSLRCHPSSSTRLPRAGLLWFAVSAIPSHPTKLPSEWEPERKAFEHTLGGKWKEHPHHSSRPQWPKSSCQKIGSGMIWEFGEKSWHTLPQYIPVPSEDCLLSKVITICTDCEQILQNRLGTH